MILSVSRRTDIPCYYADWFLNRLRAGEVLVRNPMNHAQISRIALSPEVVDCIVFWTKDPKNMLEKLPLLDEMGYRYYFQFSLTPYDATLERGLRSKRDLAETFLTLSQRIGKERVIWRYDPVILNDTLTVNTHREQFSQLCKQLAPHAGGIIISFVDLYPKLRSKAIRPVTCEEMALLSAFFAEEAARYGHRVKACCEAMDLTPFGVSPAACIDRELVEQICGARLSIGWDKGQRKGCGCVESVDIGAYNTCKNGCVYCYANHSDLSIAHNFARHNPQGELLVGELLEGEKVTLRKTRSNLYDQMGLFD